jgi:hypothetical protein
MYATLFVTLGLLVCGIFVPIFQCKPVTGAWSFVGKGVCINYVAYLYASSSVNVFTDIVLCALPIPHLWRLSKSMSKKSVNLGLLVVQSRHAPEAAYRAVRTVYMWCWVSYLSLPFQKYF